MAVVEHEAAEGSVKATPLDTKAVAAEAQVSGIQSHLPTSVPHDNEYAPSIVTSNLSHTTTLEVDPIHRDISEVDSFIADSRDSASQSVRSSIYEFIEENGRTFHKYKEGKYILPNDTKEQDRLDLQHQMCLVLLDGKLHLAPIENPQNVLDVGTGTGIWAVEFANQYPSAKVTGTDLSPIQPTFVPPNCQFEVDDAEDEWIWPTPFDYIHMRGMMTCFSNPRAIIAKAFDALAPGGYLEMQDSVFPMYCHDDTLEGTALDIWGKACVEGAAKLGRPWTNVPHYRGWMEELGFEEVKEKKSEIPINAWPKGRKQKVLGMWWQADLLDALGASMAVLVRGMGWSPEKVEKMLVDVRADINNKGVHGYMPTHIVWGRKPLAEGHEKSKGET